VFLLGLLLGIAATLAVTEQKIALVQTEEGFKITGRAPFLEKNKDLPKQIVERAKSTLQK
jgi:hypothetical protein